MSPLRDAREAIVREDMESENRHEFDATMGTFHHPRYEIVPTGEVHDGEAESDRLVCERLYFDAITILGQLGIVPGLSGG